MASRGRDKRFHAPFACLHGLLYRDLPGAPASAPAPRSERRGRATHCVEPEPQVQLEDVAAETAEAADALFLRAIGRAVPLPPSVPREAPVPTVAQVRLSDEELALAEFTGLDQGDAVVRGEEAEEVLFGLAPGVNSQLLRQLAAGDFAYRHHLDLHGLRREEAHDATSRFVARNRREGERCILIITGRGRGSPDGTSVLRQSLPRWLSRMPCRAHVLAFCTAKAVDGGPGAFYVLLRRPGDKPCSAPVPP